MKNQIIALFMNTLLSMLDPQLLKTAVDKLLDAIEDAVADSKSTLDDKIILPLIGVIRNTFEVPDNDLPK